MDGRLNAILSLFCSLSLFSSFSLAATPSNAAVPPFQWLELTSLLTGSGPPGLSYASIGYDPNSQTLLFFGGEANGIPQQQTYLLSASSLSWSSPNPPSGQADSKPPARSMAIGGEDFAASNRHGHVIIGGKGTNGPLGDAWEYDYQNQFWTEINISPGGPSSRYSASGGRDAMSAAVSDPIVEGPNNTFYLAGGFDGSNAISLSDIWKFEVAGVLSSNNVNATVGSWTQIDSSEKLPSRVRQGGVVMPSAYVTSAGGCSSDTSGSSCASQDAFNVNVNASVESSFNGCPAPRVGPVPNFNTASSNFQQQALMLLGLFDNSTWNDDGGLNKGEVDVLDINTGEWTRIVPSPDPSAGVPTPREGAAALSYPTHIFGNSNSSAGSDIVIFGGLDAGGNYLNDIWLLRSYGASLSQSNATWSGFGDGTLSSGVGATGSGVTIQYVTSCATQLSSPTSSGSGPGSTSPTSPSGSGPTTSGFDTDVSHKVLSPVSLIAFMSAVLVHSLSTTSQPSQTSAFRHNVALGTAGAVLVAAYGLGIAGLASSFTTITSTSALSKRSSDSSLFLKTSHGKAALALVVVLYGLLPFLLALSLLRRNKNPPKEGEADRTQPEEMQRKNSNDTGFTALMTPTREKGLLHRATVSTPDIPLKDVVTPSTIRRTRARVISLFGGGPKTRPQDERRSTDTTAQTQESLSSSGPQRSFEVLNRGNRVRRLSASAANVYSSEGGHSTAGHSQMPRSLSDLNWLDRRQNVAAFGELDYALTHIHNSHTASPVESAQNNHALYNIPPHPSRFIATFNSLFSTLLQLAILGLSVVTLIELFNHAPIVFFALYLIWTIAFYVILYFLIRRSPSSSTLASSPLLAISSLFLYKNTSANDSRADQAPSADPSSPPSRPMSRNELYAFPQGNARGPYLHQPLFRRALSPPVGARVPSSDGNRSDEDDEDDETQQRRIEQEMDRRDVSIVTVPKRKLYLANPS